MYFNVLQCNAQHCNAMLCSVLCSLLLCFDLLCYVILCRIVLRCVMLCCAMQYYVYGSLRCMHACVLVYIVDDGNDGDDDDDDRFIYIYTCVCRRDRNAVSLLKRPGFASFIHVSSISFGHELLSPLVEHAKASLHERWSGGTPRSSR